MDRTTASAATRRHKRSASRFTQSRCLAPERTAGGHLRLTPGEVRALRQALGTRPSVAGLTWQDTLVLAALSRHPLGLVSARAVALRAGISPTTAARALRRLREAGYVEQVERDVAEAHVRRISLWQVRYSSPRWLEVAAEVGEVDLPEVRVVPPSALLEPAPAHLQAPEPVTRVRRGAPPRLPGVIRRSSGDQNAER
ncbi:MAG: MarR family transcriptional regulator [Acidimicrobiales bacterium]